MNQISVYDVPMPQIMSNCNGKMPLDMRMVVCACLCMEVYPTYSNEISLLTEELGHRVSGSKVGLLMKQLCLIGFMRRERVTNGVYCYKPDNWMLKHRAKWMSREARKDNTKEDTK